jgi:hypothetical protein
MQTGEEALRLATLPLRSRTPRPPFMWRDAGFRTELIAPPPGHSAPRVVARLQQTRAHRACFPGHCHRGGAGHRSRLASPAFARWPVPAYPAGIFVIERFANWPEKLRKITQNYDAICRSCGARVFEKELIAPPPARSAARSGGGPRLTLSSLDHRGSAALLAPCAQAWASVRLSCENSVKKLRKIMVRSGSNVRLSPEADGRSIWNRA